MMSLSDLESILIFLGVIIVISSFFWVFCDRMEKKYKNEGDELLKEANQQLEEGVKKLRKLTFTKSLESETKQ